MIGTERMGEQQMAAARKAMQDTLEATFGDPQSGKLDFNNAGASEIADRITVPLQQAGVQLSDRAAAEAGRGSAHFPQHAAAFRLDHQFRSTVGGVRRKPRYY